MGKDEWLQNLWLVAGLGFLVWLLWHGAHSDRWQRAWGRLRRDRFGVISGAVIALYLLLGALETVQIPKAGGGAISILGWMTSRVPAEETFSAPLATATLSSSKPHPLKGWHLLGTDALGKDVLVQTVRACRTALIIGGVTSAIYIPLGTLFGILAGFFRRWVDDLVQYVYTVLYSIPEILLLISILLVLGEKSLAKMSFALAITGWVGLCRLIRGETMRQAERPYVAAARALGQSRWKIITSHLLPNVLHLVLIQLVLG